LEILSNEYKKLNRLNIKAFKLI